MNKHLWEAALRGAKRELRYLTHLQHPTRSGLRGEKKERVGTPMEKVCLSDAHGSNWMSWHSMPPALM